MNISDFNIYNLSEDEINNLVKEIEIDDEFSEIFKVFSELDDHDTKKQDNKQKKLELIRKNCIENKISEKCLFEFGIKGSKEDGDYKIIDSNTIFYSKPYSYKIKITNNSVYENDVISLKLIRVINKNNSIVFNDCSENDIQFQGLKQIDGKENLKNCLIFRVKFMSLSFKTSSLFKLVLVKNEETLYSTPPFEIKSKKIK